MSISKTRISRKKSTDHLVPIVVIDDNELASARQSAGDYHDNDDYDSSQVVPVGKEFSSLRSIQRSAKSQEDDNDSTNLTVKEFNYTMSLVDNKINVLYKLCRFIADQQQETSTTLKKLVVANELSDNFWNVSFLAYLENPF